MFATRFLSTLLFSIVGISLLSHAAQQQPGKPAPLSFRGVTPGVTAPLTLRDDERWGEPAERSKDGNLVLWEFRPRGYKKVVLAIHQGRVRTVDVFPAEGLTLEQAVKGLKLGELSSADKFGPGAAVGVAVPRDWKAHAVTAGRALLYTETVGGAEQVRLIRYYGETDVPRDPGSKPTTKSVGAGPPPAAATIVKSVARLLPEQHLSKHPLDAEIAGRWLKLFVRDFDQNKMYFTQDDIDGFQKKLDGQADRLRQGDIALAFDIFKRFRERLDERLKLAKELLDQPFDFSGDDVYTFDQAKATYVENELEAREIWRKRLMFELLEQNVKVTGDDAGKERVTRNLNQFRTRIAKMDDDEVLELALAALARAFDPRSTYIGTRSWRQFQDDLRAQFDGVGVQVQAREGGAIVLRVIPGGPAHKDGRIKEGDLIIGIAIDDTDKTIDLADKRLHEIVKMIRGPRGTKVKLEVIPAGQAERIFYTLPREPIVTAKARGVVLDAGPAADDPPLKIGYLLVPSLYGAPSGSKGASCSADVRRILTEGDDSFRAKGVDLVILDLRTNWGGTLTEAVDVPGLFMPGRPIVQVKSSDGKSNYYAGQSKESAWDGPVVVLTSRDTASGAEIVVGALQSLGRGIVVGESTAGSGTVQSLFDVGGEPKITDPKLGVLRITHQVFYRPNGESTQKRGIIPDIPLPWLTQPAVGEAAQDYATEFDRIDALRYERFPFGLTAELRMKLRAQSAERTKASAEFQKLARLIAFTTERIERGSAPLNLKKHQEERAAREQLPADQVRFLRVDDAKEVERDFYFDEVLAICRDYWRVWKK